MSEILELEGAHPIWSDGSGLFGLIAGQTYFCWCELMCEFIGNDFGVLVGLVREPDALVGRVMCFFAS